MDLLQELRSRLPENATLEQALTAFYEMGRIPNEYDDDEAYLFEAVESGIFSSYFTVSLTRQYQTPESGDEYLQLTMEICYEPNDEINELGDLVWADTAEELMDELKGSPLYSYLTENDMPIVKINVDLNGT